MEPFSESDFDRLIAWSPTAEFLLQWAGPPFTFPLDRSQLEKYLAARRPLLLLGALALIVGAGGVPFTTAAVPLFGLRIMQSFGYVAFTTAATAGISDLAEPNKKGSTLALFGVSANLAMTITPMVVNATLNELTVSGAFGVSAALAALAGLLSLGRTSKTKMARSAVKLTALVQFPSTSRSNPIHSSQADGTHSRRSLWL